MLLAGDSARIFALTRALTPRRTAANSLQAAAERQQAAASGKAEEAGKVRADTRMQCGTLCAAHCFTLLPVVCP